MSDGIVGPIRFVGGQHDNQLLTLTALIPSISFPVIDPSFYDLDNEYDYRTPIGTETYWLTLLRTQNGVRFVEYWITGLGNDVGWRRGFDGTMRPHQ